MQGISLPQSRCENKNAREFLSGGPGIIREKRLTGDAVWTGAEPEKYALLTIIVS